MDDPRRDPAAAHMVRLAALRASGPQQIRVEPDTAARAEIVRDLDLSALRKVRMDVRLIPEGAADWRLEGQLGATVVQPCVATLEPVTTRIDVPVLRRYLTELPDIPEGEELEIPEDDSIEPLPAVLDLMAVLVEDLALNLPQYPHVDGAAPVTQSYAEPGITPMTEDDTKPFAGLAGLRDRLGDKPD